MKKTNNISIFSSFAKDYLYNEKGNFLSKQKGGPAYYITQALKKAAVDFKLEHVFKLKTEILIKENDEFGKITAVPVPFKIDFSNIDAPYLLISSLLNEFSLDGIGDYKGQIFLDIQGYVRDGQDFGKKKHWRPGKGIQQSIFCLKAGDYEISYIPKSFIEIQKEKILLITKGTKGCDLFVFGKKYSFETQRVIKTKNTLGAGDTFFANFVSNYMKTENPLEGIHFATDRVLEFLSSKKI
ncbi:MAG: hypothetical protein HYW86_05090 [Candidatus Roizmanbacteria bacterium]|nr:MAG: hypothetical protein HYW86_05090 [Candidatus Roizmanbacteria bacterium]